MELKLLDALSAPFPRELKADMLIAIHNALKILWAANTSIFSVEVQWYKRSWDEKGVHITIEIGDPDKHYNDSGLKSTISECIKQVQGSEKVPIDQISQKIISTVHRLIKERSARYAIKAHALSDVATAIPVQKT